jgi:hypothetical protein
VKVLKFGLFCIVERTFFVQPLRFCLPFAKPLLVAAILSVLFLRCGVVFVEECLLVSRFSYVVQALWAGVVGVSPLPNVLVNRVP